MALAFESFKPLQLFPLCSEAESLLRVVPPEEQIFFRSVVEQGGVKFEDFPDFRTEDGSSQGQNLAMTGLLVPDLLDSGLATLVCRTFREC